MRVLLLSIENNILNAKHPDYTTIVGLREFKRRQELWDCPNLGLLSIAAHFPSNWEVEYIDLNYEQIMTMDYDVVFMSVTTAQAMRAYEIGDMLRERGTIVVLGGIHPSVLPNEAVKHADSICIGESENYLHQLINDLESRNLRKIYQNSEEVSMMQMPIPRYELALKYPYHTIPVQVTRGCPHACIFCASTRIYGTKHRCRDLISIEEMIRVITRHWRHPLLFFTDDNLFIDDYFTKQFLDVLGKYRLRWYAFSDVSIGEKTNILRRMREVGCQQLLIGLESLSTECLGSINDSQWKQRRRATYEMCIEKVQANMIGVVGSFVLGMDGDSKNAFREIEGFVEKTNMYATNITIATPFPGTRLYEKLEEEGRIFQKEWSHYNGFELTFIPEKWSIEQFGQLYIELQMKLNSPERISGMLTYFKEKLKGRE